MTCPKCNRYAFKYPLKLCERLRKRPNIIGFVALSLINETHIQEDYKDTLCAHPICNLYNIIQSVHYHVNSIKNYVKFCTPHTYSSPLSRSVSSGKLSAMSNSHLHYKRYMFGASATLGAFECWHIMLKYYEYYFGCLAKISYVTGYIYIMCTQLFTIET